MGLLGRVWPLAIGNCMELDFNFETIVPVQPILVIEFTVVYIPS